MKIILMILFELILRDPKALATGTPALECYFQSSVLPLESRQRTFLCSNTLNHQAPLRCFEKTLNMLLTNDQRVNLCQGAQDNAPFECFINCAFEGFTFDHRIKLCNETPDPVAPARCVDQVRTIPISESQLTLDQQVILCGDASTDDPVRCFISSSNSGLSIDQRVRLCTQLTPSSW